MNFVVTGIISNLVLVMITIKIIYIIRKDNSSAFESMFTKNKLKVRISIILIPFLVPALLCSITLVHITSCLIEKFEES